MELFVGSYTDKEFEVMLRCGSRIYPLVLGCISLAALAYLLLNFSRFNASRLCALGAKIYFYKGFLHSKMLIADGQVLSIGSANLDVRSFFLSYEANAIIFDQGLAESQTRQFITDMQNCTLADQDYFRRLPLPIKFMMPVCQLFSPLL